ncbi:WG repeat-containing protein [Cohnella massiliensis]|uniref:WG repeat-containing protein n=1 Tax=Cohnella massiliensis TaxID=1816691 RepID=UPI0009BBEB70|nr:WG repeat-containing protein [Cohnella massiliensis]
MIKRVISVLVALVLFLAQLFSVSSVHAHGDGYIAGEPRYAIKPMFEDMKSRDGSSFYAGTLAFSDGVAFVDYQFIDKSGKVKFKYPGSSVLGYPAFKDGLLIVESVHGVLNNDGNVVVKPYYYDDVERIDIGILGTGYVEGVLMVKKNGMYGLISRTGEEIVKPQYEEIEPVKVYVAEGASTHADNIYTVGFVKVKLNGKYGLRDLSGKNIVSPQYDDISVYPNSVGNNKRFMVKVKLNGVYGLFDTTGKEVVAPKYREIGFYSDGLAPVLKDGKYGYIDQNGAEVVKPHYDFAKEFSGGYAGVKIDGKWGYIDQTGKEVVKPQYSPDDFIKNDPSRIKDPKDTEPTEPERLIEKDGKYSMIDRTGREIILNYEHVDYMGKNMYVIRSNKKYGLVDKKTGKEIVNPRYDKINVVTDTLFSVVKDGKQGFVDSTGKEVVHPQYDIFDQPVFQAVSTGREGLILVTKNGKFGLIDFSGNEVIKPQFDYINKFSEGVAAVEKDGLWGFIYDPLDIPSDWAKPEIEVAYSLNLIPEQFNYGFTSNINRVDFSRLIVNLIEVKKQKSISEVLTDQNRVLATNAFNDTNDPTILAAYSLGIVGGKGNGIFDPNGDITRQEAAVMLARTSKVLGIDNDGGNVTYADDDEIAGWAKDSVSLVSTIEDKTNQSPVMGSTGNNNFSPKASYTKQQAFITMKRLFNAI